jgi:hypothetical protein
MDTTTLLIIIIVILLVGTGGPFYLNKLADGGLGWGKRSSNVALTACSAVSANAL